MLRRVMVLGVAAVVLALGAAAAFGAVTQHGSARHVLARHHAPAPHTAAAPNAVAVPGTSCFVGAQQCSVNPCVVFVHGRSARTATTVASPSGAQARVPLTHWRSCIRVNSAPASVSVSSLGRDVGP